MTATILLHAAAWVTAGFGFGLAYFAALRRSVDLYAAGRGPLVPALLTAVRIALAIAVFAVAAKSGATALLGAFAGFLVARAVAVRAARRVA